MGYPFVRLLALTCLIQLSQAVPSTQVKNLAKGLNNFALRLHKQLLGDDADKNIFTSPYSISVDLAMIFLGARGQTATQMKNTLGLAAFNDEDVHELMRQLNDTVFTSGNKYTLTAANGIFGQKGSDFKLDFKNDLTKYYSALMEKLDFKGNAEESRKHINGWVSKQTEKKINELLKKDDLSPETILVLVNAIYFKALWLHPFKPDLTTTEKFWLSKSNNTYKEVPMMKNTSGTFKVVERVKYRILELPYVGEKVSMLLLLPHDSLTGEGELEDLEAVEKSLDANELQSAFSAVDSAPKTRYSLKLPKFSISYRKMLKDSLKDMGMPDVFSEKDADLSGMIDNTVKLYLSTVAHQGFVEVTEKGTEAAGATGGVVVPISLPPPFHCNKPFLFIIRENPTKVILFLGRVVDPQKATQSAQEASKPADNSSERLGSKGSLTIWLVFGALFFSLLI